MMTLTMAVSYWLEVMDRDEQVGMDEQLDDFLEAAMDDDRGIFSLMYGNTDMNKNRNIMNKKMVDSGIPEILLSHI